MPGVLSVIEQWIEEHTPAPSQEGNYPPREAEVKKGAKRGGTGRC